MSETLDRKLFRKVDPGIWDDEKFIALDDDAQSIFLLLLTGPQTCSIPGLQLADVYTLASARRWDAARVLRALDTLSNSGLVELDARLRVVRLPNAPKHNAPDNPSVLVGWWKEYQRLPNSELKRRHVASILAAVAFDKYPGADGKDPLKSCFQSAWDATFGTVADTLSNRLSQQGVRHPVPTPCGTSVNSEQGAVNSEQGAVNESERGSAAGAAARAPSPEQAALGLLKVGTVQNGPSTPEGTSKRGKRSKKSASPSPEALEVLVALNEARRRVIGDARTLAATEPNLKHIGERLAEHSLDDLKHVIAVCEAEVKADPEHQAKWFDAVTTFRSDNFARKLARTVDMARKDSGRDPRRDPRRGQAAVAQGLNFAKAPNAAAPLPQHTRTGEEPF